MYSKPERRRAPPLPEKSGTELDLLRKSIQTKPLKSKADLLVRKLNTQVGRGWHQDSTTLTVLRL